MAACSLKIELDDPNKVRVGGEVVTGTIIVQCDQDSNCKGLELSTTWSTHGRGNIDSGAGETVVAYQGHWHAGQEYRYPFKLTVAHWPPTYYGNYLNVSHCVRARAKLAWKTDPKVEREFSVVATSAPVDLQPQRSEMSGVAKFAVWILLAVVAAVFSFAFIWLLPIIAIVGSMFWFFRYFLPKQITGVVKCDVNPKRLRPGESVRGHLSFTPKRSSTINRIIYTISCTEKCVSGSGSNRKTHTHELLSLTKELLPSTRLQAGQLQSFDFDYQIPLGAAPSMKLRDNEIHWAVTCRIDIPSWPDWTATHAIVVEPKAFDPNEPPVVAWAEESQDGVQKDWFDQVLEQLQNSEDRQRLQIVLDAIRDHEFSVTLYMEEDLDSVSTHYLPKTDGKWMYGYDDRRDLVVSLFVPHTFEAPAVESAWRGRISIVDYAIDDETLIATMLATE